MLDSDIRRSPRLGIRLILLCVMVLPLLCGAIASQFVSDSTAAGKRKVAVVEPAAAAPDSAGGKLTAALSANRDYEWEVTSATEAARRLSDHAVLAVVTIPDTFAAAGARQGAPDGKPAGTSGRVTVLPAGDPADPDYARLEQTVSAAALRAGIEGLLVSVSRARTNLNVASLTAAGLKAAAVNADGTVNEVLNSVKQLFGQTDPLVAQAENLVAAMHQYSALVDGLASKLQVFADSMRGVTLTLGDLQSGVSSVRDGLDAVDTMLQATATVRAEMGAVLQPIVEVLRASGLPEGQRVGDQLTGLLTMVNAAAGTQAPATINTAQVGTQLLDSQLHDMSELLGKPVDAQTSLVDLLDMAVVRLTEIRAFMQQGDATINQVMAQLDSAKELVPSMEGQIRGQLEQLKAVTAQLVVSLNTGVNGLPDTSPATVDRLSQSAGADAAAGAGRRTVDTNLLRAVLAILLGALAIVLARAVLAEWMEREGWAPLRAVVVSWTSTGLLGLALAFVPALFLDRENPLLLFACAGAAVFAAIALSAAAFRVFGRVGLVAVIASIAAVAVLDGAGRGDDAAFGIRLLPGSYVFTGLDSAGLPDSGAMLILSVAVLIACGICAAAAYLLFAGADSRK
ncbi:hypothetical protein ACRS6B_00670 [Nocardia asteroides]